MYMFPVHSLWRVGRYAYHILILFSLPCAFPSCLLHLPVPFQSPQSISCFLSSLFFLFIRWLSDIRKTMWYLALWIQSASIFSHITQISPLWISDTLLSTQFKQRKWSKAPWKERETSIILLSEVYLLNSFINVLLTFSICVELAWFADFNGMIFYEYRCIFENTSSRVLSSSGVIRECFGKLLTGLLY